MSPQHMDALHEANRVRLARCDLKRDIFDGKIDIAVVIRECPWQVRTMSVADLLMSQRRWGATRTRKFLAEVWVSESKTVGSLTVRQREEIASRLVLGSFERAA